MFIYNGINKIDIYVIKTGLYIITQPKVGLPGGLDCKESACQCRRQFQSLGQKDPLEKGMPTHSSILAWRIPQKKESGGYSPWGHKESDKIND